ncbi:MAG TPA: glutamine--fructose-6-phosphate transaminase (isomerizing) [Candidatus Limnocylindria bacterium]|jgi:glucosamine--fructose-6-phosphate aminotransferase (isomerizing)|nr:glutamine--fructose-6-phosphate transaminase (isomerizing) [Candidatus Limnocylindria bacterium]
MCGIVGYVGPRDASGILMAGLRKLEYRGYDSAGLAAVTDHRIEVRRCVGKLDNLAALLREQPLGGTPGIGHTRWATHGRPSEQNAHPHRAGRVVVIHNGIIENYLELRAALERRGRTMASETDTEVISHLIDEHVQRGAGLFEATRHAIQQLEGSYSIVVLSESEPDRLVAAKSATPIVLGLGEGENFVASDIPALLDHTRRVVFLEDGEVVELTPDRVTIQTFAGEPVTRAPRTVTWDPVTAQKGGYKHFLLKEIHEQPQAIIDTMRGRIVQEAGSVQLDADVDRLLEAPIERAVLVACGTAWHACLVGKFLFERLAGLSSEVDYGSEFRYRDPILDPHTLLVVVSQSGETADTLAAVEAGREKGAPVLAVCNVVDSSIARRSSAVLYTHAGPEISVASTKAFTTQLTALYLLALHLGRRRGLLDAERGRRLLADLVTLPHAVKDILAGEAAVERLARRYGKASDVLYLGRGINYPVALEGALKLKEISYIHAEGYAAGEMKHGPIALINEQMPVVVLIPHDGVFAKTLSNLKEVESRGGRIIVVTDAPSPELEAVAADVLTVPQTNELLTPTLLTVPLQLLAYHVAVYRGTDVDQPRNLAKSVTVE